MYVKKLRQKHLYSQEHLSEVSGLSLRTIQRVEQGHRVSYSSLRKLAAAFDIDVDLLERELYAMNSNSDDFTEKPLWIRLVLGKGWLFGTRRRYEKLTSLFMVSGIVFFVAWISLLFWLRVPALHELLSTCFLTASVALLLAAWFSMYCIRLGDRYKAWQTSESGQSNNSALMITGTFLGLIIAVNAYSSGNPSNTGLVGPPPWHFLGVKENDEAFKEYVAQTRLDSIATDGGRKLLRFHEKGLWMVVNPEGEIDVVRLSTNKDAWPYQAALPLSLNMNMNRGDIEDAIGEPVFASEMNFGNTRVQYLIGGARLGVDAGNVILEVLYHTSTTAPPALHSPASFTLLQPDTL